MWLFLDVGLLYVAE